MERRFFETEMRIDGTDEEPVITGYASVFNQWSEPIWRRFKEQVKPGAFAETIRQDDIRGLYNHDVNLVMGRNRANTLDLLEDSKGLEFRIRADGRVSYVADLVISLRRGDVSQASFGFENLDDHWHRDEEWELRDLLKVKLFDVSPVTFPAYTETEVQVRAMGGQGTSAAEIDRLMGELREIENDGGADVAAAETRRAMMRRRLELAGM